MKAAEKAQINQMRFEQGLQTGLQTNLMSLVQKNEALYNLDQHFIWW